VYFNLNVITQNLLLCTFERELCCQTRKVCDSD
jgi:hypothetical protein